MLTCRYEIQAYFRSIYWSCSAANAVESRSFTIGLFMETKLFRLFWFYKISDVLRGVAVTVRTELHFTYRDGDH